MFIKDQYFHYFLYLSKKKLPFLYVSITNTCSLFVCFFFLDLPMANTTPIVFLYVSITNMYHLSMNDIFIVFFFLSVTNIWPKFTSSLIVDYILFFLSSPSQTLTVTSFFFFFSTNIRIVFPHDKYLSHIGYNQTNISDKNTW